MRKLVVALIVVGSLLAACGSGGDSENGARSATTAERVTTAGERTTTTKLGPNGSCSYLGTDRDLGYMQVDLTFTNTLGQVTDEEVTYALLDQGTRFFTGTAGGLDLVNLTLPRADENFRIAVDTREKLPANINAAAITCRVLAIEEGTDIGGYERAADTDTCKVLGVDSGKAKVDLAVTSPYKETTAVQVWFAMRGPGGVRFETGTEVVDLVAPGETFKVSGTSRPIPAWVGGPSGVTCAVAGFWKHPGR